MLKRLATTASLLALLATAGTPAKAASVNVDMDITLSGIVILYCYSPIHVSVSSAELLKAMTGGSSTDGIQVGATSPAATHTAGTTLKAAIGLTTTPATPTLNSTVKLQLENVCGVRAIGGATGNVTVSIPTVSTDLLGGGTDATNKIVASNFTPSTTSIAVTSFATFVPFHVTMDLDLSGVKKAATFEAATSGVEFVVTATAS